MKKNIVVPIKTFTFGSLLALSVFGFYACEDEDTTVGSPTVESITAYTDQGTPNAGPVGTVLKLTGTYYSTKATNTVKFNGVEAQVIASKTSTSNLTVIVPPGATTGKVTVTVGDQTGTSATDFTVNSATPAPAILEISPNTGNGVDGVELTITGFNFSLTPANNVVKINGVSAGTPISASATSLKVIVPSGATTGKVSVAVNGATGTASSDGDFTVPSPAVANFTPKASIVGSTVEITGTKFSKIAANNVVRFNGVTAVVQSVDVSVSPNVLIVTVPGGASTGKISVSVDGIVGTSGSDFTVN